MELKIWYWYFWLDHTDIQEVNKFLIAAFWGVKFSVAKWAFLDMFILMGRCKILIWYSYILGRDAGILFKTEIDSQTWIGYLKLFCKVLLGKSKKPYFSEYFVLHQKFSFTFIWNLLMSSMQYCHTNSI
jgi:hypothetical protein